MSSLIDSFTMTRMRADRGEFRYAVVKSPNLDADSL
jgi:hypothetical protein